MQEDNVSPNNGDYFFVREPVEQAVSRKKERALTLEALPILKKLVENLEVRIEYYSTIDSIPASTLDDPAKFMHTVQAHKIVKRCLDAEKGYIESLLDANAKNL